MESSDKKKSDQPIDLNRREFLKRSATSALAFTILPRYVLGGPGQVAPSDKVNVAIIGSGGQGTHNMRQLLQLDDAQIMAICDVNEDDDYSRFYYGGRAGRIPALKLVKEKRPDGPECKGYIDFLEMLDKGKDIDAVLVATPDHAHAITCLAAIERGKHVYCEKPLARTIYEARKITEAARKAGVATQLGNHGHSGEGIRMTVEWIRDGAIGDIREVHAWIDSHSTDNCGEDIPTGSYPVPAGLDWERWIGPAKMRPYHPDYCPVDWRGWWDFGTGKLGDFGCHHMDPAFWALDLDGPVTIQARIAGSASVRRPFVEMVYYDFPARGEMPPVRLTWYSGLMPPKPPELEEGRRLAGGGHGILFVGEKGKIMCGGWGGTPRLIPEAKMQAYTQPEKTIRRSNGHHRDWIDACKGGEPASSNFDYSGPLTEFVLLGVLAVRSGKRLNWDPVSMRATNADVEELVIPTYYNGWTI